MKALKISAVLLFILLLGSLTLLPEDIEQDKNNYDEHLILNFYKPQVEESSFKVREEINAVISEMNISESITFYNNYTNNQIISREIIQHSLDNDIPVNISFAIAWQESRFNPSTVSPPNRNGSRDWGLFQLNDGYRQNWTRSQLLNTSINAQEGISHFKWCKDHLDGDVVKALQAYNAGMTRVVENRAPDSTLQYVENILNYESVLDEAWNEEFNF